LLAATLYHKINVGVFHEDNLYINYYVFHFEQAPEFYFKTLSKKLKLNLGEILNLTAALEKI